MVIPILGTSDRLVSVGWVDDEGVQMGASEEAVVRRFYEDMCTDMCTGRKLDLAEELFASDHVMHDPQVPSEPGARSIADVVSIYQQGADAGRSRRSSLRATASWSGRGVGQSYR